MPWTAILIVAGIIGLILFVRRIAFLPAAQARNHLKEGAVIVDVRSPSEFNSGHLPGAINCPLSELPRALALQIPDRDQVLLLHCLSGGRSAMARRLLRGSGYAKAFNLGSYARAELIVRTCQRPMIQAGQDQPSARESSSHRR